MLVDWLSCLVPFTSMLVSYMPFAGGFTWLGPCLVLLQLLHAAVALESLVRLALLASLPLLLTRGEMTCLRPAMMAIESPSVPSPLVQPVVVVG